MQVLQVMTFIAHVITFSALQFLPETAPVAALSLLGAPVAVAMNSFAASNYWMPRQIKPLKLYAIKWHTALSVTLFLAYLVSGISVHGAESLTGPVPMQA
jgi:hypothetical protein